MPDAALDLAAVWLVLQLLLHLPYVGLRQRMRAGCCWRRALTRRWWLSCSAWGTLSRLASVGRAGAPLGGARSSAGCPSLACLWVAQTQEQTARRWAGDHEACTHCASCWSCREREREGGRRSQQISTTLARQAKQTLETLSRSQHGQGPAKSPFLTTAARWGVQPLPLCPTTGQQACGWAFPPALGAENLIFLNPLFAPGLQVLVVLASRQAQDNLLDLLKDLRYSGERS